MTAAKKADWQTKELPAEHNTIPVSRIFSPRQIQCIKAGFVPQQMEDKWLIFWHNNALFFHRSWTGYCIYVVRFAFEGDAYRMFEADLNRDPDQYSETSDEGDAKMISHLIDEILLQRKTCSRSEAGNNLSNSVMISDQGEVVFQGNHADKPIVREENGMRKVFTSDGKLIMQVPLDELERDDDWFKAFKDPDEGDIEVLPTKHIATGELYPFKQPAMEKIPSVQDYFALDGEAVSRFNAKHRGTKYELQVARGPSYGAGDIEAARVVLLYANGGYDPEVDELKPVEFSVPGWPLTWLSPDSAKVHPGAHRWLSSRLRELVEKFDAQFIAQQVANLNVVPWSSTQYHARCLLPSREVQLRLARAAAARGAVLVAVRARSAWEPVLRDYPDQVVLVRNPRSSYISQGNLGPEGWQRVVGALGGVPVVE